VSSAPAGWPSPARGHDRRALTSLLRTRSQRLEPGARLALERAGGGLLALAGEAGFVWRSPARTLVTAGTAARVPVAPGPRRLERLAATVQSLLGETVAEGEPPGGAGGAAPATSPAAGGVEPVALPLAAGAIPFDERSPGELVVPAVVLEPAADGGLQVSSIALGADPPDPVELAGRLAAGAARQDWPRRVTIGSRWQRPQWRAAVETILRAIRGGRLDKAVLAREVTVEADRPFGRAAVLGRLAERAGGAYLYASGGFVGASPELLIARHGRLAGSRPLAGTVPRGATPAEEARRQAWLRTSAKEALEHRLVVEAVAGALAKAAERVEVAATDVVRLPTVAHLATAITAELDEPAPSALDLVALLHPTPAVAGTPREEALELLAALEPGGRGLYGGPVGWMDAAGDGEWAVALRCASLDGPRARLVAGAGIVAGSDPDAEWDETASKLQAMLEVLTGP
jgi:menaquinone-specific isochorismate synthase